MNDDVFSEVYDALRNAPLGSLDHAELSAKIRDSIRSLSQEEVSKVVRALASLYRLSTGRHVTSANLANDLYEAIRTEGRGLVAEKNAPTFKEHLTQFLELEALNLVAAKARELQSDVERALCDARILTDIRPIFGGKVSGAPLRMIVVHTLKLVYHEGPAGDHKEIYIALDSGDIHRLREVLARAEEKEKSLTAELSSAGIKSVQMP